MTCLCESIEMMCVALISTSRSETLTVLYIRTTTLSTQAASIKLAIALAKTPTSLRERLLFTGSRATKTACATSLPSTPMASETA